MDDRTIPEEEQSNDGGMQEFPPGMAPKMLNLVKTLNDLEKSLKSLTSQPYHEVLNKVRCSTNYILMFLLTTRSNCN